MEHLARLLGVLRHREYRFLRFGEPAGPAGCVYLRHDIDLSLGPALRVAELEAGMGVAANFFFLTRSGLYNLLSREGRHTMSRISALGHSVGLHFDASFHANPGPHEVAEELRIVAGSVPDCSPVISLHRPPTGLEAIDRLSRRLGHRTTYDRPWTRDIDYSSDSSGQTRRIVDAVTRGAPRRASMQLLVHPFWWDGEAAGVEARVAGFVEAAGEERRRLVGEEVMPGPEAFAVLDDLGA